MCYIVPERTRMNSDLIYQGSDLMLDRLPLATIAREYGTPVYVYSASSIRGEIQEALDAGCPADRIVFSGVGKTQEELTFALDHGIFINAESEEELATIARLRTGVHVGIRINPC